MAKMKKHDQLEDAGHGPSVFEALAGALAETVAEIERKMMLGSVPSALNTEIGELRRIEGRLQALHVTGGIVVQDATAEETI